MNSMRHIERVVAALKACRTATRLKQTLQINGSKLNFLYIINRMYLIEYKKLNTRGL